MKPGEKVESQKDSVVEVIEEQKPLSCDKEIRPQLTGSYREVVKESKRIV